MNMTFAAIFATAVGVGMITQWTMSFASGRVPELQTEPIRILFHITAEAATALSLVVGGVGLLTGKSWGAAVCLVSLGMLIYSATASPGYFAQRGHWTWVLIFSALITLAAVSAFVIALGLGV
jgi:hypothetical protein